MKMNSLVDEGVIDALYLASQQGLPVQLVTRAICALRPGVPGLSETIEVRSILGRFLEHSRVYWFDNGGDPEVWIGSADMMHRNLDRRVEVLVRVTDPKLVAELESIMDSACDPATRCWVLGPDGRWSPSPSDDHQVRDHQVELIQRRRSRKE